MPAAWSSKDERMYKHILKSCRRTDGRRSLKTCKRIAAATVNKQRGRESQTLGDFVIFAAAKPGHPDTEGWTPGWAQTCDRFSSRADAEAAVKKYGRSGARYRIQKSSKPSPAVCTDNLGGIEELRRNPLFWVGALALWFVTFSNIGIPKDLFSTDKEK